MTISRRPATRRGWSIERLDDRICPVADFSYAQQFAGIAGDAAVSALRRDSAGNLYAAGRYTADFDADPSGNSTVLSSAGAVDFFVVKLDSSGGLLWAKSFGGTGSDSATAIGLDSSGNVFVGGGFSGPIDFGVGPSGQFTASGVDAFVLKLDNNGNPLWARSIQGTGSGTERVGGLTVDGGGNVISVGSFDVQADFDPGAGTSLLTGSNDAFVWKLSPAGDLVWAKSLVGGTKADQANAVVADASGNVFVAGQFQDTVDFDPSVAGVAPLVAQSVDGFVLKLTSVGDYAWVKSITGSVNEEADGIALDGTNVLVAGGYSAGATFAGVGSLANNGGFDAFALKLDGNGNFQWVKGAGGAGSDFARDVAADSSGNVTLTGQFAGTVDFDPSGSVSNLSSTASTETDIFVWKLTAAGAFAWARSTGTTGNDAGATIVLDGNGASISGGSFAAGSADFDPGASNRTLTSVSGGDGYLWKFDSAGTFQWANNYGDTGSASVLRTTVDSSGNVYLAGSFQGTVDFDPSPAVSALTAAGSNDVFVAKFTAGGSLAWVKGVGGPLNDTVGGVAVDGSGNVFLAGGFSGTADFNPDAGVNNATSAGGTDLYLLKLSSAGAFVWCNAIGGTSNEVASGVAVDSSGNAYIAGQFTGTTDFDPTAGTATIASTGSSQDGYVASYTSAGVYRWADGFGGNSPDQTAALAVYSGGVTVTGFFSGLADFDPGAATAPLTSYASSQDVYVLRLTLAGAFTWVKQIGGTSLDQATSLAVDAGGNCYIGGTWFATADFDPGPGTANVASNISSQDGFVCKLDNGGNYQWVDQFGGTLVDAVTGLALDGSGGIVVAGTFNGTIDLDPTAGTQSRTSSGATDVFVVDLTGAGAFTYARNFGGAAADTVFGVAATAAGDVVAVGSFMGAVDFDPGAGVNVMQGGALADAYFLKLTGSVSFPPLTVTANQSAGQPEPTNGSAISFTVVFSNAVTGFNSSDVQIGGTTGATNATVFGSGTTYTVSVSGMTQSGTVTLSVPGAVIVDGNGTSNAASTSSDNSVVYDSAGPTASLSVANVTTRGGSSQFISVTYSDPTGVSTATLGNGDLLVTGPNGYSQLATFLTVTPPGNGSPRTATYSMAAPGGNFDAPDNGNYTVTLNAGQVSDTLGNVNASSTLGSFAVQAPAAITGAFIDYGSGPLVSLMNTGPRSRIPALRIVFDGVVTLGAGTAFSVSKQPFGLPVSFTTSLQTVGNHSEALLTFGTPLADARYRFTAFGAQIQTANTAPTVVAFDGDDNGTAGGDFVLDFFELAGDLDGSGSVDAQDVTLFLNGYGTSQGQASYAAWIDLNGSGAIDAQDVTMFLNTYGTTLP